eukprot:XP_003726565.1 PREDICTED: protein-lysine N-methyltransferase EEF2KMT isoform X1 [Strongylocentrotus purpuratus]
MDKLVNQFFEMIPLRQCSWGDTWNTTAPSLEEQQSILKETLMSPVCKEFPPSLKYRKLFVKHILKQCEEHDVEIADELYEVYSTLVAQKEETLDRFFKTYKLPTGNLITLKESSQVVIDGTTGLRSWPAAQCMVEWIAENTHIINGRRVLELGSGLGLTGLASCDLCQPLTYTFSDCHEQVLKTLQENILLNIHRNNSQQSSESETVRSKSDSEKLGDRKDQEQRTFKATTSLRLLEEHSLCDVGVWFHRTRHAVEARIEGENGLESNRLVQQDSDQNPAMRTDVSVCCIDWENVKKDWLGSLNADVILATDVIYDTRILPSLVHVLSSLLSGPDNQHTAAYIASTIRNEDTYKLFLEMIDDANIVAMEMTSPQHHLFHYDKTCSIQILRLTQKR